MNKTLIAPPHSGAPEETLSLFRTGPIEQDYILDFADAARDFNPIHCDPSFASSKGFHLPLVHGVLSLSLMEYALQHHFGPDWIVQKIDGKFTSKLFVGQSVTGLVSVLHDTNGGNPGCLNVRFKAISDDNNVILMGKSTLVRKHP